MSSQELPSKVEAVYRTLQKLVDKKDYKKALKTADQVLKTHPDHGETLSFKALCLDNMSKKDEATETAKLALSKNIRSPICWHVFGMIHRGNRNNVEAIKCFRMAARLKEDMNYVRELASLEIQVRDFEAYASTRKRILTISPSGHANWVSFSLAHRLLGNHEMAIGIMQAYASTLDANRRKREYEESEMHLYTALLFEEKGDLEGAISYMEQNKQDIVDLITYDEKTASLLMRLGRFQEAREVYNKLLGINPECYEYHRGLQACILGSLEGIDTLTGCQLPSNSMDLEPAKRDEVIQTYRDLLAKDSRPIAFNRIPLDLSSLDEFKKMAEPFLLKALRKGVPSLFSSLRSIYKTALERPVNAELFHTNYKPVSQATRELGMQRVEALGQLMEGYLATANAGGKLEGEEKEELPTFKLWCLFYLAQHYDTLGDSTKALNYIDEAIQHTPTLVDSYHIKGRILKHTGNLVGAAESLEEGRNLDLADKFINTRSAKYQLRAGLTEKAESVIGLFTRHEGDSRSYLIDMQCIWYETEAGFAYMRAGNMPLALKFFKSVEKHFEDFEEDQYDFHQYCLRKGTIRAYMDLLKMEDNVRHHKAFTQAAHGGIMLYLKLHDHRKVYDASADEETLDYSKMSAAEKKKAKLKARKAEQKKKKAEEEAKSKIEAEKAKGDSKRRGYRADDDPDGEKLFAETIKDPLEIANKLNKLVVDNAPLNLQTHLDCFEVQMRRRKYLQAFRALYKASKLVGYDHHLVFPRLAAFLTSIETGKITYAPWAGKCSSPEDRNKPVSEPFELTSEIAKNVIAELSSQLLAGKSIKEVREAFYKQYTDSSSKDVPRRIAACKSSLLIGNTNTQQIFKDAIILPTEGVRFGVISLVQEFLEEFGAPQDIITQFKENTVKKLFPNATICNPAEN